MTKQKFKDIYSKKESVDAILNEEFHGFKDDYLILHSLIRKYQPKTFFEIGTNRGTGTNIICNAIKKYCSDYKVFSLDLPISVIDSSLKQNSSVDLVGINCSHLYIQLRADSMTYDYSKNYPIEGWFIDGAHDYIHPNYESKQAIKSGAKIIIWHDADIPEVYNGIVDAFKNNDNYKLYRVTNTRIAYAIRKK